MRLSGTRTSSIHQYRGLGDQLWDLGGARSTLDLNFAHNKSLVDSTTGQNLITFTRASSGTYVDSAGVIQTATNDVPRFDHNPTTGESLGLLVEEARTNLLLRSEEFDQSPWNQSSATVTPNQAAAPDGTTTADLLVKSAAYGYVGRMANISNLTTHTFSVYIKKQTNTNASLLVTDNGAANFLVQANINLDTGAVTNLNGSTTATPVGSNWYRVSTTFTYTNALNRVHLYPGIRSDATTGGVYIWGAQLELGSFATSYIPTTSATVTRSADVASITGSNFSSWYNQTEGAVFSEYRTPTSGTRGVAGFNDATANECLSLFTSGTDPKFTAVDGGVTQADLDGGTVAASTMTKTAAAYAANNFSIVHAGAAAVTDVSGTLPTVTRLLVGADQAGNYQCGRIKRLTYWPTRLSDTTLQKITQ